MYAIAISYSNIQLTYGIPCSFVGLLLSYNDNDDIPTLLTKDRKNSHESVVELLSLNHYTDLMTKYNDIILYKTIVNKKVKIVDKDKKVNFIFNNYYNVLNNIISYANNKKYIINSCYLRVPEDYGMLYSIEDSNKSFSSWFYNFDLQFQDAETSNGFLDLSRALANYEYLKKRRENTIYLNNILNKYYAEISQFIRMKYKNPYVEEYGENFIGYPELLYRHNKEIIIKILKNDDFFYFYPIAKYCLGPSTNVDEMPPGCVTQSARRPFGTRLKTTWETCKKCKDKLSTYESAFTSTNEKLGMNELFDHLYYRDYLIYISIFNKNIKVGRALLTNAISRLVEQTASEAIVFYPILTFKNASIIEKGLIRYLKNNIVDYAITDRVKSDYKYEYIKNIIENGNNENSITYDIIFDLIRDGVLDKDINILKNKETLHLNFKKNWIIPDKIPEKLESIFQYNELKGIINGIIGQYIIMGNIAFDFNKLNGYVGVLND